MDRGAWQATYSPCGCKELDMTEHAKKGGGWGEEQMELADLNIPKLHIII